MNSHDATIKSGGAASWTTGQPAETGILIVDDDAGVCLLLERMLRPLNRTVHVASSGADAERLLLKQQVGLAVLDFALPDCSGGELLQKLRVHRPQLPALFITALPTVEQAVALMKLGDCDYMAKPLEMADLLARASQLLQGGKAAPSPVDDAAGQRSRARQMMKLSKLSAEVELHRSKLSGTGGAAKFLEGGSAVIRRVVSQVENAARHSRLTVLLTGETGTGKSMIARRIHELSCGDKAPFVEVDCSTLPAHLFESELFGHEQGAFTGATRAKAGPAEVAGSGTLFLDEIGELEPLLQTKLLRLIESRTMRRVGGSTPIAMNARIIAATNRSLKSMVSEKTFREDLYYRLDVFEIQVPRLRDRPEDIPGLAEQFLASFNAAYAKHISRFSDETMQFLCGYHFPGNVRELRNLVERAVINSEGEELGPQHIHHISPPPVSSIAAQEDVGATTARAVETLDGAIRETIRRAMTASGNNQTSAAKLLGLTRSSLQRHLAKYFPEESSGD